MFDSLFRAIAEGIGLGITVAILGGPAFFALLQTSIRSGFKPAIAFAAGVFVSDCTLVLLSYLGALRLVSDPKNNFIIGIIGGTILIMFGIFNIFQKHPLDMEESEVDISTEKNKKKKNNISSNLPLMSLKGFAINIINPFVILFWISVVTVESTRYEFQHLQVIVLFTSTLLTILSTDVLKALAANKITGMLTPDIIHWINRIAGIILIICGLSLIIRVVNNFLLK